VAKRFVTKSTNATSAYSLTVSDFNGQAISNGRRVTVARRHQQRFATAKDVAVFDQLLLLTSDYCRAKCFPCHTAVNV